jgi:3-hydroxy-D-aspartate aldolase
VLHPWASAEDRAIVDAGLKALASTRDRRSSATSPPRPRSAPPTSTVALSVSATSRLGLGDKIRLIPGHCDPTVNLYDWSVCVRGNRVEQVWPITAGGAVY